MEDQNIEVELFDRGNPARGEQQMPDQFFSDKEDHYA